MPRDLLPDVLTTRFSDRLKDATKAVHREAERSGFIADLIRGRATRDGYVLFLRNLVPAYAAMEQALEGHRGAPVAGAFADPRLRRLPALVGDLEAIAGTDWASRAVLPAATAYAAAIEAAAKDASRLAAQAYARYLGDLSGGQILKPILARNLGLAPEALRFYDFPQIDDIAAVKASMREALDVVPSDSARADAIITEAIDAFRHNIAVSEAVRSALG